jgi:plastocyanin
MHTIALVLAAEKSKVPFYIAGGLLTVWALTLSLGLGMRKPGWPPNATGQRTITAITAVLVLAALATAVVTSSSPAKGSVPPTQTQEQAPIPVEGAPVSTSSASSSAPSTSESTASTSTPAPSSTPAAGGASSSLKLAASPGGELSYNTKTLSAKAGTVTITMANMSPLEHNVTIAEGSKVLGATPTFIGGTRTLTLKLKPGKYTFYCSVPGHRQAGMEGTLNVS